MTRKSKIVLSWPREMGLLFLAVLCLMVFLFSGVGRAMAREATHTILLVGDSTVETRKETHPSQGWGAYLGEHLNAPWKVVNCASSGASTKTFLDRKNWQDAQKTPCDYLFIQFGHNDSHGAGRPESTDAATDFKEYLGRYLDFARENGIQAVLITPPHRRTYDKEGKLKDRLAPYAEAIREMAQSHQIPLIDLHTPTGEQFAALGDEGSADLTADRTHFTRKGAAWAASLVAQQAAKLDPTLEEAFAGKVAP